MSCPVRRRAICARWLLTRRMFRFFRKRRAETERPKIFSAKTSPVRVMSRGLVFYENCAHRTGNCSYRLRSLSRPCGFCPETDRVQFRSLEAGRFVADCPRFIPCGRSPGDGRYEKAVATGFRVDLRDRDIIGSASGPQADSGRRVPCFSTGFPCPFPVGFCCSVMQ